MIPHDERAWFMQENLPYILRLTPEMLLSIFQFLSIKDIANIMLVNKKFLSVVPTLNLLGLQQSRFISKEFSQTFWAKKVQDFAPDLYKMYEASGQIWKGLNKKNGDHFEMVDGLVLNENNTVDWYRSYQKIYHLNDNFLTKHQRLLFSLSKSGDVESLKKHIKGTTIKDLMVLDIFNYSVINQAQRKEFPGILQVFFDEVVKDFFTNKETNQIDPDIVDEKHQTYLCWMIKCHQNYHEILQKVEEGHVASKDPKKQLSIFYFAIVSNHIALVKYVLFNAVNLNIDIHAVVDGLNAYSWAILARSDAMIKLFEEHQQLLKIELVPSPTLFTRLMANDRINALNKFNFKILSPEKKLELLLVGIKWLSFNSICALLEHKDFDLNQDAEVEVSQDKTISIKPLLFAVTMKRKLPELAQWLLDAGANPNLPSYGGKLPLHEAVGSGLLEMTQLLLKKNADPNLACAGKTPLFVAALAKQDKIVELLLNYRSNQYKLAIEAVNTQGCNALYAAVFSGSFNAVTLLLAAGSSPHFSVNGTSLLHLAAEKGYHEILSQLISYQAKLTNNAQGLTPLYLAVRNGHVQAVALLLPIVDSNVPENYQELFNLAVNQNHDAVAALLLPKLRVNERFQQFTPLCFCVLRNKVDLATQLLALNADPNMSSHMLIEQKLVDNITPLYMAVMTNNFEMLKLLLKYKADPKIKVLGKSLLRLSIENNSSDILSYLLSTKVFEKTDLNTMLLIAVASGKAHMVEILLQYQADVNVCAWNEEVNQYYSALHYAIANRNNKNRAITASQSDYFDVITILVKHGAHCFSTVGDVAPPNMDKNAIGKKMPLDICVENQDWRLAEYILTIADFVGGYDIASYQNMLKLLIHVIKMQEIAIFHKMMKLQIDVNTKDAFGATPLFYAICFGQFEMVKGLIRSGAIMDEVIKLAPHQAKDCREELKFILKNQKAIFQQKIEAMLHSPNNDVCMLNALEVAEKMGRKNIFTYLNEYKIKYAPILNLFSAIQEQNKNNKRSLEVKDDPQRKIKKF
jgi:ankyrin repeat protein